MDPLVVIRDAMKSYGTLAVLRGISLEVAEGEKVAIVGRSGSGKSTLLRCINGLEGLNGGAIHFEGAEIHPKSRAIHAQRSRIGFVFQNFNLFPHMTALENVAIGLSVVKRMEPTTARETAARALHRVGLSDKINSRPSELSGGQQQRVGIARAIAMEPRLLLLDEPTSALDPELIQEVLEVIRDLARSGQTMVLVTHEMRFAANVADRVIHMDAGRVVAAGSTAEMFGPSAPADFRQFVSQASHE